MKYYSLSLIAAVAAVFCIAINACSQVDYVSVDPAIRDMEISLEMPRPPAGSTLSSDPAIRGMQLSLSLPRSSTGSVVATPASGAQASTAPVRNAAGTWRVDLMDGTSMDLSLLQSGGVVFGRGSVTSGGSAQWATASGFVQGSGLRIDVVPAPGDALYALALDLSALPPSGTYTIFRAGSGPRSGILRAGKM